MIRFAGRLAVAYAVEKWIRRYEYEKQKKIKAKELAIELEETMSSLAAGLGPIVGVFAQMGYALKEAAQQWEELSFLLKEDA